VSAAFWFASRVVLDFARRLLESGGQSAAGEAQRTHALMAPHGALEIALWIALSLSAGFCEEFVFRGYLQRQLGALTRNALAGVALSALLFGVGHAYQGWRSVALISLYGLMFGLLAHFARSLKPGMLAHAWQDIFVGLS
jgi:membrane protease YdiL (CAAX protease family)